MTERPVSRLPAPAPVNRAAAVFGIVVLVSVGLLAAGLVALVMLDRAGQLPGPGTAPTARPAGEFAYVDVRDAPPLDLTDQDGNPFTLASLRGRPVLLFFGYTHCPDVCPTTVGVLTEMLGQVGDGPRVVFTSIDPDRDDVAAMKSYLRYLSPAFVGLSGTPTQVRTAADAWGVQYAKIDTGSAGGYAMAHTADVFLVDAQGRLRARFPFGTDAASIAAFVRTLLAETPIPSAEPAMPTPAPATATPVPAVTPAPVATPGTAGLVPIVVSSSVWAGGQSPVILRITDAAGAALPDAVEVRVRGTSLTAGSVTAPEVRAVAIRPTGETELAYVATMDFPSPGAWRLDVTASTGAAGSVPATVLDPGATTPLGAMAPDIRTPTVADVGGVVLAVTTNPQPDLRLSQTSTADARAAGEPYVLVIDSARFRVTQACGRALAMVRYLLDRWTEGVAFIHLEPFVYSIITSEPVLGGDISNPPLNSWTRAWGIGDSTWTALDMPWVFVVDGSGIVRAKYTGIVGSADVDVMVSLITGQGVLPAP